jgi:hypothetical protein
VSRVNRVRRVIYRGELFFCALVHSSRARSEAEHMHTLDTVSRVSKVSRVSRVS